MVWECERGCGQLGSKQYATSEEAIRFAAAFNRKDSDDLGRRAPLIGLFPLRVWRRLRSSAPRAPRERLLAKPSPDIADHPTAHTQHRAPTE
ncbi:MAG TPA: hypothetical protein VFQ01_04655 [Nocardioides sp.]|jgi:hypothetical protein|nr:hypothetical protein [Nocardioides sp.]